MAILRYMCSWMALSQLLALSSAANIQALARKDPNSCVNTAETRECWTDGFDINTDYEVTAPPGVLREYDLTITQETIAPDGYAVLATVFNGQYPGPTIEANWGDTVRITIHNNLTNDNGTAVHWHGIRQLMNNWQDGVPGVTQCPTKPGTSQTYEFNATQYGTSWYHSHFSLQYTNGLTGPLIIHGPSSANWDVDLGPWAIADWYHDDAFQIYAVELLDGHAPRVGSTLLNGKGISNCTSNETQCENSGERYEVTFEQGTKYKIGLENTGSLLTQTFWIDGHNFTIITNDFVAIEPYETNVLNIGIGQRYEIIVEANPTSFENGTNFWIHAQYCHGPVDLFDSRLGVIRYNATNTSDPYSPPAAYLDYGCADPDPTLMVPVVPKQVGNNVNGMSVKDYLKIGLEAYPNTSDPNSRIHKWVLKDLPMYLDWEEPSLKKITLDTGNASQFDPITQPIVLDYDTGEWVYFVITNNYSTDGVYPERLLPQSVHPIHLHGHDFVVLAQGEGPFTSDIEPNLDNPNRRDVINCPLNGYVWIAFQIDNPGAWLMHCHIAWHASDGLAIQFLEQPDRIKGLMEQAGALSDLQQRCEDWTGWYTDVNEKTGATQEDSGI